MRTIFLNYLESELFYRDGHLMKNVPSVETRKKCFIFKISEQSLQDLGIDFKNIDPDPHTVVFMDQVAINYLDTHSCFFFYKIKSLHSLCDRDG